MPVKLESDAPRPQRRPRHRTDRVQELELKLRAASAQRTLYGGVLANRLGLNQTDLECLFLVTFGQDTTAGQLAQKTGLTSGAITGIVDRIEAAGYVNRVRDPRDRRRWFLVPVAARIEEIRAINRRAFHPWIEELSTYSDAELDVLLDFADRNHEAAIKATLALRAEMDSGT